MPIITQVNYLVKPETRTFDFFEQCRNMLVVKRQLHQQTFHKNY